MQYFQVLTYGLKSDSKNSKKKVIKTRDITEASKDFLASVRNICRYSGINNFTDGLSLDRLHS
jgi:hypothetical protein